MAHSHAAQLMPSRAMHDDEDERRGARRPRATVAEAESRRSERRGGAQARKGPRRRGRRGGRRGRSGQRPPGAAGERAPGELRAEPKRDGESRRTATARASRDREQAAQGGNAPSLPRHEAERVFETSRRCSESAGPAGRAACRSSERAGGATPQGVVEPLERLRTQAAMLPFTGRGLAVSCVLARRPVTLSPHSNANQARIGKDVASGGRSVIASAETARRTGSFARPSLKHIRSSRPMLLSGSIPDQLRARGGSARVSSGGLPPPLSPRPRPTPPGSSATPRPKR